MFGRQHMQVDSHHFRASENARVRRTKFPCEFSRRIQLALMPILEKNGTKPLQNDCRVDKLFDYLETVLKSGQNTTSPFNVTTRPRWRSC